MDAKSILADSNGNELPSPVSMTIGDTIIWSSKTGRTSTGKMMGAVIAEKKTVNITWEMLTKGEWERIKKKIPAGYVNLYILGEKITVYRDTISSEAIGYQSDGVFYFRSTTTSVIQR